MTEQEDATENRELMRQVRELGVIKAPSSLHEKLMSIPDEHVREKGKSHVYGRIASVGLAAAAVILIYSHLPNKVDPLRDDHVQEEKFSQREIREAKQDLALAFHYLSEVSSHTSNEVNMRVTRSSTHAIYKGVFFPLTEEQTHE